MDAATSAIIATIVIGEIVATAVRAIVIDNASSRDLLRRAARRVRVARKLAMTSIPR